MDLYLLIDDTPRRMSYTVDKRASVYSYRQVSRVSDLMVFRNDGDQVFHTQARWLLSGI